MRNTLDNMVLAVAGLPRVGSNPAGSNFALRGQDSSVGVAGAAAVSSGSSPSIIPTTSPQEQSVVSARKTVMAIMEGNALAPRMLAKLFAPWMHLVGEEAEAFGEALLGGGVRQGGEGEGGRQVCAHSLVLGECGSRVEAGAL